MEEILDKREEMVKQQLRSRGIRNPRVLEAMKKVPREEFVSHDLVEFAYEDSPLPIDEEQTISQPYIVALQAEYLEIEPDDIVLDIGTGSGYAAAVLSELAEKVYTIERHEKLAKTAQERFDRLGYDNIFVLHGDGTEGWPEHAPFDAVNVAAGGPRIPENLREQLANGGRMIIPIGDNVRTQRLVLITKRNGKTFEKNLGRVQFVPLIGRGGWMDKEGKTPSKTREELTIHDRLETSVEPFEDIENTDFGPPLDRIGDAKVVLIGDASHGTSEFYQMREQITRALIEKKGFNIVSTEADWPDAAHIDRYVRDTNITTPEETPFKRFPNWMWNNEETLTFAKWLKEYNDGKSSMDEKVGFYGLDLYSMYTSIDAIIDYLDDIDPDLAEIARNRYGCLTPYEQNPANYGAAAMSQDYRQCADNVTTMLKELLEKNIQDSKKNGVRYKNAVQNARLVANAEEYYRSMYLGAKSSWNLRDSHMFETLKSLLDFEGDDAKAVVWAHNSHIGDASATEMGARGEHNIGQLVREEFGDKSYNIGFGTDHGTVAAAHNWGGKMRIMDVRPSLDQSVEKLMHQVGINRFMLPMKKGIDKELNKQLVDPMLERAIGVIYRPKTERQSHYFQTSLYNQFDEYIWLDETSAVKYKDIAPQKKGTEKGVSQTYPFGL